PTDRCNSGIMVRLSCEKCGCSGQYRKDTLIARYGADIRLPDLRWEISHCERQGQMHDAWHLQGMAREAGCGIPPAGWLCLDRAGMHFVVRHGSWTGYRESLRQGWPTSQGLSRGENLGRCGRNGVLEASADTLAFASDAGAVDRTTTRRSVAASLERL